MIARQKHCKFQLLVPLLAIICLVTGLATESAAQTRGNTETETHSLSFDKDAEGISLGTSLQTGIRTSYTWPLNATGEEVSNLGSEFARSFFKSATGIDNGWVDPLFDAIGILPLNFNIGPYADVIGGGYFEMQGSGEADLNVAYPVSVVFEYPEPNSFGCGDTFEIRTSLEWGANPDYSLRPPWYNTEVGVLLEDIEVGIKLDLCVEVFPETPISDAVEICGVQDLLEFFDLDGTVPSSLDWEIDLPQFIPPLMTVCAEGFDDPDALFGCGNDEAFFYEQIFPGGFDISDDTICLTTETGGYLDLINKFPETLFCFTRVADDNLNHAVNPGGVIRSTGRTDDIVDLETDIISWFELFTKVPLSVDAGVFEIDAGDISPSFMVDQIMDFEFSPDVTINVNFERDLVWEIVNPADNTVVDAGSSSTLALTPGHTIRIVYPQELSSPTTTAASYAVTADLTTDVDHQYSMAGTARILEIDTPSFDWDAYTFTLFEQKDPPLDIQDDVVTINNFDVVGATPEFALDPENPVIDIMDFAVADIENIGRGQRHVVYRIDIRNNGDVRLDDVQADLDLGSIFATAMGFEVICVTSSTLTPNPDYDGNAVINVLAAGNSIDVEEDATIEVKVVVTPAVAPIIADGCFGDIIYTAMSEARGVSPIGTPVKSDWNHCEMIPRGDIIMADADLGAAKIEVLEDFAIYGWDGVSFARSFELSRGNVGSDGDFKILPYEGEFSADPRVIGDLHVGGNLFMTQSVVEADYLQLGGQLKIGDPNSELILTGAISSESNCVATQRKPSSRPVVVRGNEVIEVAAGESLALIPGDYKSVSLAEGAVLDLGPGTYNLGWLRVLGAGARILCEPGDDDVNLNIQKWFEKPIHKTYDINGELLDVVPFRAFSIETVGEPGASRNVFVNYAGPKKLIVRNGLLQGNFFAPKAEIRLDEGTRLEGTCYAKRVRLGPYSSFAHHDYLEPVVMVLACDGSQETPEPDVSEPPVSGDDPIEVGRTGGEVSHAAGDLAIPKEFHLGQNYPNPFNPITSIPLETPVAGDVYVGVYDVQGHRIRTLHRGHLIAGRHSLTFEGANLPSGVYFVRMVTPTFSKSSRMILLK